MTLDASKLAGRARIIWRMRLISALRTALACAIVGGATLYGSEFFVKDIKFAAFSYLTVEGLLACILCDSAGGPARSAGAVDHSSGGQGAGWSSGAGGVGSLVPGGSARVHTPDDQENRVWQIVLVCTDAVLIGRATGGSVMHPVYVAASTGFGAVASVLALLLPYPDLGSHKIRKLYEVYGESAYQRINLYSDMKMELLSQAKALAENGAKLLHNLTGWQRFAIARLAEVSIGLSVFVAVEILLQPL